MASTQIKQCFYIISGEHNSKDIYDDIDTMLDSGIQVFVVINPNHNINRNVINILRRLQEEKSLSILLMDDSKMENTYFAIKGLDKKITIAGKYNAVDNKALYTGNSEIGFELIHINGDPLDTLQKINIKKDTNNNIGLVVNSDEFNISTLSLALGELEGSPLDVQNYRLELEEPILMYNVFTNIGDLTLIFFTVSIIIFLVALTIFKRWSKEKFLS